MKDVYDFEKLERDVRGEISQREVEKLSELEENARRLEQARKIVEERRKNVTQSKTVTAILTARDNNFTSAMNGAVSSLKT